MINLTNTSTVSSLLKAGILKGDTVGQILTHIQAEVDIDALEEITSSICIPSGEGSALIEHFNIRDFALFVWLRDIAGEVGSDEFDHVLDMTDTSDDVSGGARVVSISVAESDGERFYNFGDGCTCAIEDFFSDDSWIDDDWIWVRAEQDDGDMVREDWMTRGDIADCNDGIENAAECWAECE